MMDYDFGILVNLIAIMVVRTLSALPLSRHCRPIHPSSTIPYPTTASTAEIAAAETVSTNSNSPWIGLFDVHPIV